MTNVNVLTPYTEKMIVQVEKIDELGFRSKNNECHCVMCEQNTEKIEIVSLETTEEVLNTLLQFGFPATNKDFIALCSDCIEEFHL